MLRREGVARLAAVRRAAGRAPPRGIARRGVTGGGAPPGGAPSAQEEALSAIRRDQAQRHAAHSARARSERSDGGWRGKWARGKEAWRVGDVIVYSAFALAVAGAVNFLVSMPEEGREAVRRAAADRRVREAVGNNVRRSWMWSGTADGERFDARIPIKGDRGEAEIEVRARKQGGRWVYYHALVHDAANRAIYDLMDPPAAAAAAPASK